jgi:hypothetical protein
MTFHLDMKKEPNCLDVDTLMHWLVYVYEVQEDILLIFNANSLEKGNFRFV